MVNENNIMKLISRSLVVSISVRGLKKKAKTKKKKKEISHTEEQSFFCCTYIKWKYCLRNVVKS